MTKWTAHRASWAIHFGPIPEGMNVCHNCPDGDMRNCVNPAHLFLGTHIDNVRDRDAKGRKAVGERINLSKITDEQAFQIMQLGAEGNLYYFEIGEMFGICDATVSHIVNRKTWKHVAPPSTPEWMALQEREKRRVCPKRYIIGS